MSAALHSLSDGELALRAQAGCLEAFEQLVYRYEARIYLFILHRCGREADAREITQDAFVRAYERISSFDPRQSFGPWLFAIARRKHIDHWRRAPAAADEPAPELVNEDDPARLMARAEERRNLWSWARRNLPEIQYDALWLRYTEDMPVAGIARVLGKTETHVKVLLFRARRILAAAAPDDHAATDLAREGPILPARGAEPRLAAAPASQLPRSNLSPTQ